LQRITLASFRRITSNGTYIPEIDGLRFIAILAVVFLHCYGELLDRMGIGVKAMNDQPGLLRLLGHGGYGVEIFFAISGFILALPFARQYLQDGRKVRLPAYFLRRVTRLEPPYILWLLIRAILLLAAATLPLHLLLVPRSAPCPDLPDPKSMAAAGATDQPDRGRHPLATSLPPRLARRPKRWGL
jgi:peptidoglycan/LPS O-acetylase OafA/YrhL